MTEAGAMTAEPTARDGVERAQGLLQDGQLEAAADAARGVLSQYPENGDALYVLAVAQRYLNRLDDALATLARLQALRPDYGRGYQEAGHVHASAGNREAALRAYRHAVGLNNSLIASWQAIAGLLAEAGEEDRARQAFTEFRKLEALPPELLSVRNMMAEGRLFRAEQVCRHFMKSNPRHVEGMRLLADIGIRAGVLDDAEFLLESAVEFEPDNRYARQDYMNVLYRRQKYAEALEQAKRLLATDPDNLDFRIAYANQCVAVGDYDTALGIYDEAIAAMPRNADLHLVHGHALKTVGETDSAVTAYRAAYAARGDFGDAFWSLANLKTYRFTDDEVARMRAAEGSEDTRLDDRVHLCFALGKHFEDRGDYAPSAEYYLRGNRLRKSQVRYDADRMSERLGMQREICTPALFANAAGGGYPAADPIFILGLPRAGSTLLEQILASHSMVDGTLELPNIPALAFRLAGRQRVDETPRYPAVLAELSREQLHDFGRAYIEDTRIHRQHAPFFIDKMPNNFRHIGLIHLILPNAKIIDARRHPMACCFSGFKQLFASGQEFSYDLADIGRYYRDYVELMDHWDAVLPGKVLRVQYEDVVADTEAQVRRMLDFCGLPFEAGCVEFHRTERSIRTPSSEQVRQPIFRSGLEQWRHFEPWLDPLKTALGPVLDRYPIPASGA